jgi:hypothetical protein
VRAFFEDFWDARLDVLRAEAEREQNRRDRDEDHD